MGWGTLCEVHTGAGGAGCWYWGMAVAAPKIKKQTYDEKNQNFKIYKNFLFENEFQSLCVKWSYKSKL